jgi:hypothetical protein
MGRVEGRARPSEELDAVFGRMVDDDERAYACGPLDLGLRAT